MLTMNFSRTFLTCAVSTLVFMSGCGSDSNDKTTTAEPEGEASNVMAATAVEPELRATNVILMISDGASDGAWDIASYWQHGAAANNSQPYSQLTTRMAMTTFPYSMEKSPASSCDGENPLLTYDKSLAWGDELIAEENGDYILPFSGYSYINQNATDSAAAGTAIATGHKTFNGAISVNYCGEELATITQQAKAMGLSTGIVSSVQYDHATPAVFGAHNLSRGNYADIGHSMLTLGYADLIMGAGHPEYDADGKARASDDVNYKYVSEADWSALKAGTLQASGASAPWALLEAKSDFEALANNTASESILNAPVFALAQVGYTLQQGRTCADEQQVEVAFACDMLATVPSLETMTQGAINYLAQNDKGFFLMVEGGAVDWAAHGNQTARIIEEQVDFNNAVSAVITWVEQNSSWDETLLIVTTDHGNSYVLGGASEQNAYAPVENLGAGVMPEVKYYSSSHTNELVRVYAKGKGAESLSNYVVGNDANYSSHYNHSGANGDYIDNTHLFEVMKTTIESAE